MGKKRWLMAWVVGQGMLVAPVMGWGAHPLITDDAGTVGERNWQLEVTGEYIHDQEGSVEARGQEMGLGLTHGLRDNLDLALRVPYQWSQVDEDGLEVGREDGFSDLDLDLKWRLLDRDGLSLAVKPGVTLPSGDEERGLGSGRFGYHLYGILSKAIGPWAAHANLGYIRNENLVEEREDLWHASLAGSYELASGLTLVANIDVDRNPDPASDSHPASLLAGLILPFSETCEIDAGYRYGLTEVADDWALLAGLTVHY